jgi:hypothetical protein
MSSCVWRLVLLQVGVVLQAPKNLPLDVLPADGCVAMAASVPAAADTAEVGIAKQTVLATAQHLQVGCILCAFCYLSMLPLITHGPPQPVCLLLLRYAYLLQR